MPKLSVIIVTYNEEKNIRRCLASVAWADEIIIVDSFSKDRTVEIARTYTEKIYMHEYPGYSLQVERGIQYSTGEWIFILDADEEVTPELAGELQKMIRGEAQENGYHINRRVFVFGKWIQYCGWSPDWQFRLMRRGHYKAEHQEIHGAFKPLGVSGKLSGYLNHFTYEKIEQYIEKMNDYTSLQVSNKLKDNPDVRVSALKLIFSPFFHFYQMYLVRKGYKDGMHGFLLSCLDSLYALSLYSKLWEYQMRLKEGQGLIPPITNSELLKFK